MHAFDPHNLAAWCGGTWNKVPQGPVLGVSIDTRTLREGDLYLAIRGDRFDGHAFVPEALAAGAAAVVVDGDATSDTQSAASVLHVPDTRRALRDMAAGHRSILTARFVGITGSVGKTTVKDMLGQMLSSVVPTATTQGNWNNHIGLPLSLLAMSPRDEIGVFELGMNHPGELQPLCDLLQPRWGLMTPVGMAHKEFFGSVEAIAREKATLIKSLPPSGAGVICRDQEWFDVLTGEARCPITTVSLTGSADYVARPMPPSGRVQEIVETGTGLCVEFELPFSGSFMVENALLAVALGRCLDIPWDALQDGLRDFRPSGMRWEQVEIDGVTVVNDAYNANPMSMRAALAAFAQHEVAGRRWLVLAGMFELGDVERAEHLALGREIAGGPWAGVVVVGELGGLLAEGAAAAGWPANRLHACADTRVAAHVLREQVAPGDAVLLKASRGEELERVLDLMKVV